MKNIERDKNICCAYNEGDTMLKISKQYNITRERVSQILRDNGIKIKRTSAYKNAYIDNGSYMTIVLSNGENIFIDKQDFEKVSQYSWCIGCGNRVVANVNYKTVYLHRYIIGDVNGVIDHINGNNRDNRRSNLRITTIRNNGKNTVSKNKYGVNGIRKTANGKYQARITVDYKYIHIGTFDTVEQAIYARKKAEQKYYGEYAPTMRYKD